MQIVLNATLFESLRIQYITAPFTLSEKCYPRYGSDSPVIILDSFRCYKKTWWMVECEIIGIGMVLSNDGNEPIICVRSVLSHFFDSDIIERIEWLIALLVKDWNFEVAEVLSAFVDEIKRVGLRDLQYVEEYIG